MKITSPSGDEFQLVVVGYQYPDLHEDRWDSNWLIVTGSVTAAGDKWAFTDPCVTTFELADFADWFDELAADGTQPSAFAFTEPNLKFAFTPWPHPTMQLMLTQESAPPSLPDAERSRGVTVEFPMPLPKALAGEIRRILMDFPIRGGAA